MSKFNINDYIYGLGNYDTMIYGKIKEIVLDARDGLFFYVVDGKGIGYYNGTLNNFYIKETNAFKSEKELTEFIKNKDTDLLNKYLNQIKTVEDLVKFGFNENVSLAEEYTDWIARDAYKIKAKELLGIDLTRKEKL